MSFHKKIQKLRDKPQKVKERILIVTMSICITLIFCVWLVTFKSNFKFSDVGAFVRDTKTYFLDSKGVTFDEEKAKELIMENEGISHINSGTSTARITSTTTNAR